MATVEDFCSYCDKGPNGFNNCNERYSQAKQSNASQIFSRYFVQELNARDELCSNAVLEGVWVHLEGNKIIIMPDQQKEFERGDPGLKALLEAARLNKKSSSGDKIPSPSVLEKLGQQAISQ